MTELVLTQIKDVLDAYSRRDVTKAMQVWRSDEEVDAVNNSLFRELLTYMMEDPRDISVCIHLLFCAKNIERMGDHATNIAETGADMRFLEEFFSLCRASNTRTAIAIL